jgi:hypothetical protein
MPYPSGGGYFLSGLLQGFGKGMLQKQQLDWKKQLLKLEQDKLKLQEKDAQIKQQGNILNAIGKGIKFLNTTSTGDFINQSPQGGMPTQENAGLLKMLTTLPEGAMSTQGTGFEKYGQYIVPPASDASQLQTVITEMDASGNPINVGITKTGNKIPLGQAYIKPQNKTFENIIADEYKKGNLTLEQANSILQTKIPKDIIEFEMATRMSPQLRGTPEYEKAYINFMKQKGEAKSTKVNIGLDLTTATKTNLENKIMRAQENKLRMAEVKKLYNPIFLTYKGKGITFLQSQLEKLGYQGSVGWQRFLNDMERWKIMADQAVFQYRKDITGVAGGEKEMKTIEKIMPNPKYDSPTQFQAKLRELEIWHETVMKWARETRAKGMDLTETKKLVEKERNKENNLQNLSNEELENLIKGFFHNG